MRPTYLAAGALAALAFAAGQARGQPTGEPAALEEVVVTAQKRAETLQDVPVAVSVFGGSFLERSRTATVSDLVAFSPGVSGSAVAQTTPRITVRGVSTDDFGVGSDPALGVYVDDIYLGRAVSSVSDLFDVEQVEIVRGPQGTLFGRNTTAGAISITTQKPDPAQRSGALELVAGRFSQLEGRGHVNVPVTDTLALRFSASARGKDGFARNTLGGRIGDLKSFAGRAAAAYEGRDLTGLLSLEYRSTRAEPGPYINPVLVGTDPFGPVSSDLTGGVDRARDDIDSYRAVLRIEHDLAPGLTVTSISGYTGFDNRYLEDTDGSPLTLLHFGTAGEQDGLSQELRLNGEAGRLAWFLGASAARDTARSTQYALYDEEDFCQILFEAGCSDSLGAAGSPRVREESQGRTRNTSYAVYGDARLRVTDRLDITVGLRFSHDRKRFDVRLPVGDNLLGSVIIVPPSLADLATLGEVSGDGRLRQRYSSSSWQPRIAADFEFSSNLNAYVLASRGYKAGGFNQLSPGPAFRPETIWNYEAGLKGYALDRRLRFDLAAYTFDYRNLQVLVDFGPSVVTRNAAAAEGEGVELSAVYRILAGVDLSGGLAYQEVRYERFVAPGGVDYSGNRLPRAPKWSASLVLDVDRPLAPRLSGLFRLEASWRSRQYFDASNAPFESQDAYALVNASAGVRLGERLELRAFVQNLADEEYLVDTAVTAPGLLEYTQRGEPRTFGVQLLSRF